MDFSIHLLKYLDSSFLLAKAEFNLKPPAISPILNPLSPYPISVVEKLEPIIFSTSSVISLTAVMSVIG